MKCSAGVILGTVGGRDPGELQPVSWDRSHTAALFLSWGPHSGPFNRKIPPSELVNDSKSRLALGIFCAKRCQGTAVHAKCVSEASRQVGHFPMLPGHRIFQRCAGMSCRSRVSLGSRKNCSQSIQTLHIPHRQHLPGSAGFQLKRVWVRVNLKNSSQKLVVGRGQRTVLLPTSVWEKNAWQWLIVPAACPFFSGIRPKLGCITLWNWYPRSKCQIHYAYVKLFHLRTVSCSWIPQEQRTGMSFALWPVQSPPSKFKCQNEKPRTQPAKIFHFWYFEQVCSYLAQCFLQTTGFCLSGCLSS